MAKKISQIFLFIFKPIILFIFKYFILPLYNLLHLIKKKLKQHSGITAETTTSNFNFLINRYVLYIFIIVLAISVIINNLNIKTAAAEDLGKQSLLYELVQGNEFEQDIVETIQDVQSKKYDQLAHSETSESLNLEETLLAKNEQLTGELKDQNLYQDQLAEEVIEDALLKTSSPATFTSPQPRSDVQEYTVQSGDNVSTIAQKFKISINTILWANDLSSRSIIRPGDKLTILPVSGVMHKAKSGDTISAIAAKYDVEQNKILDYNNLASANQLSIGQSLIIPGGEITTTYYASRGTPSISNIFKAPSSEKKSTGYIWPTSANHITQYYHWRHHAIDIGGSIGLPIYASAGGKIIKAGWSTGYGYNILLDHGNGQRTRYAHLSKFYVEYGESVNQGDVIGAMGSTGWSTGPHLHFEIIINGTLVNPLSYL